MGSRGGSVISFIGRWFRPKYLRGVNLKEVMAYLGKDSSPYIYGLERAYKGLRLKTIHLGFQIPYAQIPLYLGDKSSLLGKVLLYRLEKGV